MSLVRVLALGCGVAALLVTPAHADAQWYLAGYLGGNHTRPADIHISQPSANVDLTYRQVSFEARPLESPQYYGWRFGRLFGEDRRFGVEFEFTHLKMYAETSRDVGVTGRIGATTIAGTEPMDLRVQRYSMSHGLNFIVANVVSRTPLSRGAGEEAPAAFVVRGGTGRTWPHAETVIFGMERQQYEWSGPGFHAAAGLEMRMVRHLSAIVEYKLTYARPTITLANGTGQTTALTQHVTVGVELRR